MAVQRLTAAYRSRPRPSSTPGAKASAIRPKYLDGEHRLAHEAPGGANTHLAFVQFSSSTEAYGQTASARGPWKLSSNTAPERRACPVDISGMSP